MSVNLKALKATKPLVKDLPSTMGKLFVAVLCVAIFEGAFRKWLSSDLTIPLLLLRDSLAFYGIYWTYKAGKFKGQLAQVLLLWTVFLVAWGILQFFVVGHTVLVLPIGLRFWLFYLWFGYAAGVSLTHTDFNYISLTLFKMLLFMTPLALVQFYEPPGAFINQQVDGDESTVFRVTADIVRTTGTFSFTLGYTTFLALVCPFVLNLLKADVKVWGRRWLSILLIICLLIASLVSGSRAGVLMMVMLLLLYFMVNLFVTKSREKGKIIVMMAVMLFAVFLVTTVLSRAVDATQERIEAAYTQEDPIERITAIFLGEPGIYENLDLLGKGLGLGSNLAAFVMTGDVGFTLTETEAGRIILEAGFAGFLFTGLKLLVLAAGLRKSFVIANQWGDSLPLMIWITLCVALLTWSIIFQLTVNVLGFLFFGLGVASLRLFNRGLKK